MPKARQPERDYSHRGVLDKLGVQPGLAVARDDIAGSLDPEAAEQLGDRLGRDGVKEGELADLVIATVDASVDLVAVLERWKGRIDPRGGIWLLTPKRKYQGYVPDVVLIEAGRAAGLVDNKVCSVSEGTSAMRFVFRKSDRPT